MLGDDLIRGAQAASEFMGGVLSATQVYRLSAEGKLPCIRKGRSLYFRKSELEDAFRSDLPAERDAA